MRYTQSNQKYKWSNIIIFVVHKLKNMKTMKNPDTCTKINYIIY